MGKQKIPDTVPNVTSMLLEDAEALLLSYGYSIVHISASDDFMPSGRVICTIPAAGEASTKEITVLTSSGYFD